MQSIAKAALGALAGPGLSIEEARTQVPERPGLYAIYGATAVYVGKSGSSLIGRDLRQHFTDGRTGSSTLRRSFAALLHDKVGFRGVPRNPAKPERFANYGLSPKDDRKLTAWMLANLQIATWAPDLIVRLADVEHDVVTAWLPPLNLAGADTPWHDALSAKRRMMAAEAKHGCHPRRPMIERTQGQVIRCAGRCCPQRGRQWLDR